ncbi:hypothetical protein [Fulvivirga sediminis]|uniref:Uncharacterized protein n=1 Tax=Fulvivirga sediminis TaxID=2803949 RepID=A0A937FBS3_9BACT|nr:hypothetical protein [Fulvivirga sediminis]MBL3658762.1 hypothetical protein [Fulvivirga sediminis]
MENKITRSKNALVVMASDQEDDLELKTLKENFCGTLESNLFNIKASDYLEVYVCGDLAKIKSLDFEIHVIKELSCNYDQLDNIQLIDLGKVPLIVHNAGVYFKNLFGDSDYFNIIQSEHVFQELTESTKQSKALRKGIYLTTITKEQTEDNDEILHFNLLRCSSNLTGPTDNFRETDLKIMAALNKAAKTIFEKETELNHVLAQVYENKKTEGGKETKAKIKAHSDKTKDMPKEGLIAFCTFYDNSQFEHLEPSKTDKYDWVYKEKSGLTRLLFKLKDTVEGELLAKEFSVTLYPNSAFIIPLSTNRLYTHEIRPSILNMDKIPTRMGYVARCSNLKAQYINDQVYIKEGGELLKLEPMTDETMNDLRNSYLKENVTEEMVDYKKIRFSMNSGDYKKPIF